MIPRGCWAQRQRQRQVEHPTAEVVWDTRVTGVCTGKGSTRKARFAVASGASAGGTARSTGASLLSLLPGGQPIRGPLMS